MDARIITTVNSEHYTLRATDEKTTDFDYLRKRSFELLSKFRKVWNEADYQEWCAIQRMLHRQR